MALSPEEREKIIEEETLKFETRQNLHSKRCSRRSCGRWRWLWFAAFFALGYAVHGLCGRSRCSWGGGASCPWAGMGMVPGHCMLGAGMMPQDDQAAAGASGPLSQTPAAQAKP